MAVVGIKLSNGQTWKTTTTKYDKAMAFYSLANETQLHAVVIRLTNAYFGNVTSRTALLVIICEMTHGNSFESFPRKQQANTIVGRYSQEAS